MKQQIIEGLKKKLLIVEIKDEEMYVLVAPDGTIQLSILAPDFAMCCGMVELFASSGMGQPLIELFNKGFKIMPVKVSIIQNGTEEQGFQAFKKKIS